MYIGAWTEYHLALEKHQKQLKKTGVAGAVQPLEQQLSTWAHCDHVTARGGRRGAVGIYHPSLADKGGQAVRCSSVDRESFRETLKTALSSNLAADDAEHITQALEPLLQRLPTIQAAARTRGSTVAGMGCRWSRRGGRIGSRGFHANKTHSEGTRSARLGSSSDGTRSARSSFSVASAPIKSSNGFAISSIKDDRRDVCGEYRRMIPTVPQFPRVEDACAALSVSTANGRCPLRSRKRPGSSYVDDGCLSRGSKTFNSGCSRNYRFRTPTDEDGDHEDMRKLEPLPLVADTDAQTLCPGGFDSGKAATLIRLARNRDPAGIKADFQHFWSWKSGGGHRSRRNSDAAANTSKELAAGGDMNNHTQGRTSPCASQQDAANRVATRTSRVSGGQRLSKLEALARMKEVYLAKGAQREVVNVTDENVDVSSPTPKITHTYGSWEGSGQCRSQECREEPVGIAHATRNGSDGNLAKPSRQRRCSYGNQEGQPCNGEQENDERSKRKRGRDGKLEGSVDGDGDILRTSTEEPVVLVPDMELTESRIRLVEKYFGGGGGLRRHPAHSQSGTSGVECPSALPSSPSKTPSMFNGRGGEIRTGNDRDNRHNSNSNSNVTSSRGDPPPAHNKSIVSLFESHVHQEPTNKIVVDEGESPGSAGAHVLNETGTRDRTYESVSGRENVVYFKVGSADTADRFDTKADASPSLDPAVREDYPRARDALQSPVLVLRSRGRDRSSPERGRAPVPAPAWCGDSLDDLVCWTKQLDFNSAVEGF